jgi:hypothetical protein
MFGIFGVASFSKIIDLLGMPDQVYEVPPSVALGHCRIVPEREFGWMMDRLSIFCFKTSKHNN